MVTVPLGLRFDQSQPCMQRCSAVDLPRVYALSLQWPRILDGRAGVFFYERLQLAAIGFGIGANIPVGEQLRLRGDAEGPLWLADIGRTDWRCPL
jgi:hypothetical protein